MTERLYYVDSYLTEFEAAVVDRADGGRRVYLERTAFYPTSGGQPHDTGRLGDSAVVDVVEEGDRIAHVLAAPVAGARLAGRVDWGRRFDHMQQHTGQHLLSAVLAQLFGFATVSVHFGAESSTLDLDTAAVGAEQIERAEFRANEVVWENRAVSVSFEAAGSATGLRKAPAREGLLRIVTIGGLDRSACGGTHVRATGEIGPILIPGSARIRTSVRVEFLCGARAVRRARADRTLLSRLALPFSAPPEALPALVAALRAERDEAAAARRELEGNLARFRAAELYQATAPDRVGVRRAVLRGSREPIDALRTLAQAFTALSRAVLIAATDSPPVLLVAASADAGVDAAAALKTVLARVGGRGGGTARLAQGSVGSPEQLEAALAALTA
jgi:alanyl-tRNA synthetase